MITFEINVLIIPNELVKGFVSGLLLHATFIKHRKLHIELISDQQIDKNCLHPFPLDNLKCLMILKTAI